MKNKKIKKVLGYLIISQFFAALFFSMLIGNIRIDGFGFVFLASEIAVCALAFFVWIVIKAIHWIID